MSAALSFFIGYFIGGLNPAYALAAFKKTDLRSKGTKNLGATNVTLALGFKYGLVVLALDMLKAFSSVKLTGFLFPNLYVAGLLGGCGAVYGHIYPVYMKFKGGKGLAAFGGLILAYSPLIFIGLLAFGLFMVWVTDFPIMLTFSAVVLAPALIGFKAKSYAALGVMLLTSGVITYKHRKNFKNLFLCQETRWSEYIAYKSQNKNDEQNSLK